MTARGTGFVIWIISALLVAWNCILAVPDVPPFGVYEDADFSPTITILQSNEDVIRLQLVMENLPGSGTINFANRIPGLWADMNQGGVLLPRFAIFLALPNTGNPTVTIESWETQTFQAVPRSLPENNPQPPSVTLGSVGILGGVRVLPVTFRPITYVNNANTCNVMSSAIVRIDIDDQQGENPVTDPRQDFSRPWQKLFQAVVTNWEYIPNFYNAVPSHILMIVPDAYLTSIQDFVNWKEQRGFKVTVVPKTSIAPNPTPQQLRTRILAGLTDGDPRVDFVILVGDETQLQPSMLFTSDPPTRFSDQSFSGNYTNEGYYSALEGTDVFPDLFLGRWVVNSAQEAQKIAQRTVLHERDTFLADSLRFERAAVAADMQEVSQRMTKRYVRMDLLRNGFAQVDSLWGTGQGPTPLINWINQGLTFVNYRGTGWGFGWAGINFYLDNIQSLTNSRKLPIVTGIGCGVGKFDEPEGNCFGEAWMLHGTLNDPRGSVGFIGPCWNTHTVYNDCLDSLLYTSMLEHEVLNLGTALASGKMMVWGTMAQFLGEGGVLEVTRTMFRQYLVLSDPSLQVFTDTPLRLQAMMPEAVPPGPYNLLVNVTNMAQVDAESLQVCVWMGSGNFVSRWIPQGQNSVAVPINAQALDSVVVTITGDNVLAFRRTLPVGTNGPYLTHQRAIIDDVAGGNGNGRIEPGETVNWYEVLYNAGSEDAVNVVATLRSTAAELTITQPTAAIGTIPVGDSLTSPNPFTFAVADTLTFPRTLSFHLSWVMQGPDTQSVALTIPLYAPNIAVPSAAVDDGGGNGIWERGEEVGLSLRMVNSGNIDLPPGNATVTTTDPYITIVQGQFATPALTVGQSLDLPSSFLRVAASPVTPSAHQGLLMVTLDADLGTYHYRRAIPLAITIGQISASDPFPDLGRQYWVYDNSDIIYSEHPEFDWYEIAPAAGGSGTLITPAGSDYTLPVPVPFSFRFYGVEYDTLSISTDGWVHPGTTTGVNYANQPLPATGDNIRGMIAVLWKDLWHNNESGQLCYAYDAQRDRFVVEWYQVHDWQLGVYQETFQIQLLNPATYPTESGDAAWVMNYSEVSVQSISPVFGATVGMESPTQTNGVTYVHRNAYAQGAATLQSNRAIKLTSNAPLILSSQPRFLPVPEALSLSQNYPNPFNPETVIEFALPRSMNVSLVVYDVLGRVVASLVRSDLSAGVHQVQWRGISDAGQLVGSGVYIYRLNTPEGSLTRKMVLLR